MHDLERRHIAAWLVVPFLAVANGAIRDLTYGRTMSRTAAHSLSVLPLVVAILIFAVLIERRWPLGTRRKAVLVGAWWFVLTLAFEFGLGALMHVSASEMLTAYDVTRGQLWPFVPLTMAVAPELARWWCDRARARLVHSLHRSSP